MTFLPPQAIRLDWARAAQQALDNAVAGISPAAVSEPSTLPRWTRGHVLTHLARNADALSNLVRWTRTGVPTPMYVSREQRNADIEQGAPRNLDDQRADLASSSARFLAALAEIRDNQWSVEVRDGAGQEMPASEIPWLRTREAWLHLVDLDIGPDITAVPADVAIALIHDVGGYHATRINTGITLRPDGHDPIIIGAGGPLVTGSPQHLAGWMTGRCEGDELTGDIPVLPAWL